MKNKKEIIIILIVSIIIFLIDQISKFYITSTMSLTDTIHIIKNLFRITYVQNTGAAWSILSDSTFLLILITFLVLGMIIYFLLKQKTVEKSEQLIYGSLIGGVLGNLIDRIRFGYVVDFLDFNFGSFYFPVFNLADTFIVLAGIILIIKLMKEDVKNV